MFFFQKYSGNIYWPASFYFQSRQKSKFMFKTSQNKLVNVLQRNRLFTQKLFLRKTFFSTFFSPLNIFLRLLSPLAYAEWSHMCLFLCKSKLFLNIHKIQSFSNGEIAYLPSKIQCQGSNLMLKAQITSLILNPTT